MSKYHAAYLTSVYWGLFSLGRLLAIPQAIWLKPSTMIFMDYCGSTVSILFMLIFHASGMLFCQSFPLSASYCWQKRLFGLEAASWVCQWHQCFQAACISSRTTLM